MKTYLVSFSGNASKFKKFSEEVDAISAREAVEIVYQKVLDSLYFPKDDGSIEDAQGNVIAQANDDRIMYDDGYFVADELTYDVVFNDEEDSNSKGFSESINFCRDYIKSNNGTNESYFADYKNGTVSIVCNETGEEVHSETIK